MSVDTDRWDVLADRIVNVAVKAISVRQPFAHYILHDGKDIENRDWPTKGRGWVLLHAGKKPYSVDDRDEIRDRQMPLGGIVGIVRIVDCVDRSDSPWFYGRYGFVLKEPHPLPLVPCNGALGFFLPSQPVLETVAQHVRNLGNG